MAVKKFEAWIAIEIELDGDEAAAFTAVDDIMQRNWDRTQGGANIGGPRWHYSMSPENVDELVETPRGARELDELKQNVSDDRGEL